MKWLNKQKVNISYKTALKKILVENKEVKGVILNKSGYDYKIFCDKLIICTEGKSYPQTGSDGSSFKLIRL